MRRRRKWVKMKPPELRPTGPHLEQASPSDLAKLTPIRGHTLVASLALPLLLLMLGCAIVPASPMLLLLQKTDCLRSVSSSNGALASCGCSWKSGKFVADCAGQSMNQVPNNDYNDHLLAKSGDINQMQTLARDIQVLQLNGNNLSRLSEAEFAIKKFTNLQRLYLNTNQLTRIDWRAFHRLTGLVELDLSENLITRFDERLAPPPLDKALYAPTAGQPAAEHPQVQQDNGDSSSNSSASSSTDKSWSSRGASASPTPNPVDTTDEASDQTKSTSTTTATTTTTTTTARRIAARQRTFLDELVQLRVLNLNSNQLTRLAEFTFSPLVQLRQLFLSKNQIKFIDLRAFDGLSMLNILHLDGNKLAHLSAGHLFPLAQLHGLQLASNPWRCDCRLRQLAHLLAPRSAAAAPSSLGGRNILQDEPSCQVDSSSSSSLAQLDDDDDNGDYFGVAGLASRLGGQPSTAKAGAADDDNEQQQQQQTLASNSSSHRVAAKLWSNMKLEQFECPPREASLMHLFAAEMGASEDQRELTNGGKLSSSQTAAATSSTLVTGGPARGRHTSLARTRTIRLAGKHCPSGQPIELTCAVQLNDALDLRLTTIEWTTLEAGHLVPIWSTSSASPPPPVGRESSGQALGGSGGPAESKEVDQAVMPPPPQPQPNSSSATLRQLPYHDQEDYEEGEARRLGEEEEAEEVKLDLLQASGSKQGGRPRGWTRRAWRNQFAIVDYVTRANESNKQPHSSSSPPTPTQSSLRLVRIIHLIYLQANDIGSNSNNSSPSSSSSSTARKADKLFVCRVTNSLGHLDIQQPVTIHYRDSAPISTPGRGLDELIPSGGQLAAAAATTADSARRRQSLGKRPQQQQQPAVLSRQLAWPQTRVESVLEQEFRLVERRLGSTNETPPVQGPLFVPLTVVPSDLLRAASQGDHPSSGGQQQQPLSLLELGELQPAPGDQPTTSVQAPDGTGNSLSRGPNGQPQQQQQRTTLRQASSNSSSNSSTSRHLSVQVHTERATGNNNNNNNGSSSSSTSTANSTSLSLASPLLRSLAAELVARFTSNKRSLLVDDITLGTRASWDNLGGGGGPEDDYNVEDRLAFGGGEPHPIDWRALASYLLWGSGRAAAPTATPTRVQTEPLEKRLKLAFRWLRARHLDRWLGWASSYGPLLVAILGGLLFGCLLTLVFVTHLGRRLGGQVAGRRSNRVSDLDGGKLKDGPPSKSLTKKPATESSDVESDDNDCAEDYDNLEADIDEDEDDDYGGGDCREDGQDNDSVGPDAGQQQQQLQHQTQLQTSGGSSSSTTNGSQRPLIASVSGQLTMPQVYHQHPGGSRQSSSFSNSQLLLAPQPPPQLGQLDDYADCRLDVSPNVSFESNNQQPEQHSLTLIRAARRPIASSSLSSSLSLSSSSCHQVGTFAGRRAPTSRDRRQQQQQQVMFKSTTTTARNEQDYQACQPMGGLEELSVAPFYTSTAGNELLPSHMAQGQHLHLQQLQPLVISDPTNSSSSNNNNNLGSFVTQQVVLALQADGDPNEINNNNGNNNNNNIYQQHHYLGHRHHHHHQLAYAHTLALAGQHQHEHQHEHQANGGEHQWPSTEEQSAAIEADSLSSSLLLASGSLNELVEAPPPCQPGGCGGGGGGQFIVAPPPALRSLGRHGEICLIPAPAAASLGPYVDSGASNNNDKQQQQQQQHRHESLNRAHKRAPNSSSNNNYNLGSLYASGRLVQHQQQHEFDELGPAPSIWPPASSNYACGLDTDQHQHHHHRQQQQQANFSSSSLASPGTATNENSTSSTSVGLPFNQLQQTGAGSGPQLGVGRSEPNPSSKRDTRITTGRHHQLDDALELLNESIGQCNQDGASLGARKR